jgi:hypothetical protein
MLRLFLLRDYLGGVFRYTCRGARGRCASPKRRGEGEGAGSNLGSKGNGVTALSFCLTTRASSELPVEAGGTRPSAGGESRHSLPLLLAIYFTPHFSFSFSFSLLPLLITRALFPFSYSTKL